MLIECKNLSLGYDGKTILSGLSFGVENGDYLCIVGDNGSGKSTLMKTLLGLIPPVSGAIETENGFRHERIGYLPQQSDVQRDFPASVREIVLSGCLGGMRGVFYDSAAKKRADDNMARVGISHLKKRCYRELSGGQQQRVLLARALCAADKMLLLDEPASGLDPQAANDMYSIIDELNAGGMTIVMISHDIPSVISRALHVLHIGGELFFGDRGAYAEKYGVSGGKYHDR